MSNQHLSFAECCALEVFKRYLGNGTIRQCAEVAVSAITEIESEIEKKVRNQTKDKRTKNDG